MRRLATYLIKLAGWRWTADAVDSASGIVILDAIKYDIRYLPHSTDAALAFAQYPRELGKKLTHEHTVPLNLLAEKVFSVETDVRTKIREIFDDYCRAAILTKEEDAKLNAAGLRSEMPPDRSYGDNILARYSCIGIELRPPLLNDE